jgi:ribosomal-protein-alanine N-acetyltransferase
MPETFDRTGFAAGREEGAPLSWRDGLPDLVSDEVLLREPQASDAPALVEALSNDAVGRFMSRPPDSTAGFQRFITWIRGEREAGRCFCYGLVPPDSDRVVGLIQFRAVEPGFATAEWGFALSPARWGTGIFMDAARVAVDFAFRHAGVHRLEARASVVNGRGNGALRKLGAAPEGVLRQSLLQAAGRVDQILWGVIDEDWRRDGLAPPYRLAWPSTPAQIPDSVAPRPAPVRPAWCEQVPVLEGSQCIVREVEPADVDSLREMLTDSDVQRYVSPPPSTSESFTRFVEWSRGQRRIGKYLCFGIVPRARSQAVGLIQLRALDPPFHTGEWGFAIGRPYWGTGMFPEAARLLLDFAFGTMGVHRLEARSVVENERAIRALRRLGAVFEGTLRQSFLLGTEYYDDALCSLLAADWLRRQREMKREIA